jgi:polyisoprenoid-binding protein YceI
MKKIIPLLSLLLISQALLAQSVFRLKSGTCSFFSEAPLENIDAKSTKFNAAIDTATQRVVFQMPIRNFVFKNATMQEHFNENYMESDKYPRATFDGKIVENINWSQKGVYQVTVQGKLNIHGVIKERTIPGTIEILENEIKVSTAFQVKLVDHKIEVPTIVIKNIAEIIDVKVNGTFTQQGSSK